MKRFRINVDALGVCASTLCMIHCLAFPLLLALLSTGKLTAEEGVNTSKGTLASSSSESPVSAETADCCTEHSCCAAATAVGVEKAGEKEGAACCSTPTDFWVHVGLLAAVAPLGVIAWGSGYRQHRRMGVLLLGMAGVLLLCGALLFGHTLLGGRGELVMTVAGSLCMVSAHLWNRRKCRCCRPVDVARAVEVEAATPAPQLAS